MLFFNFFELRDKKRMKNNRYLTIHGHFYQPPRENPWIEAIERQGSIQAAAKDLKMSYRALWGRITATEKRMGRQLLTRNIGGAAGGGSQLTPFAKILLENFRDIHRRIALESDRLYQQEILSKITQTDE
jgi:molybdate transport system regulatory protein